MTDVFTGVASSAVDHLLAENAKHNQLMLDSVPSVTLDIIASHENIASAVKGGKLLPHYAVMRS